MFKYKARVPIQHKIAPSHGKMLPGLTLDDEPVVCPIPSYVDATTRESIGQFLKIYDVKKTNTH